MGLCSSSPNPAMGKEEMAKNQQLEDQIARQRQKDKRINKLLLLGAGESGKSTFFKQIQNLYGKGFTEEERAGYTHIIQTNALSCMKTLCEQSDILNEEHGTAVDDALRPSKSYIEELKLAEKMDSDLAAHIKALWEDPGIKKTHNLRSKYQLNDSADYFFDRIEEIAQSDYLPTFDDICRVRVRTTGIVEMHFTADNTQFSMFDVGGQRNERKKWIHCFEDVTAVIFVAAVSAYDQVLFEDESQNRLQEAISLFSQISTSKWFLQTPIILFLNKKDLFAEKIGKAPLSVCFPNYDGDNSYEDAMAYITDQFVETANGQRDGLIYTHETCATDSQNVAVIFTAVKDHIIRASLSEGGLLI